MKYADFMGKDTGVNSMNCISKASKSSLNVRHARSAVNVFDEDGGAPHNSTAAFHDCWRKTQNVSRKKYNLSSVGYALIV